MQLLSRRGYDWTRRFRLIAEAVAGLRCRSCPFLILPSPSPQFSYLTFWLTLTSDPPFKEITFYDLSGDAEDQYFGNVVSGPAPVPLPLAWCCSSLFFAT